MSCPESSCQICKFVSEMEESVVYSLSVQDVIDGSSRMPFANRIAWLATQRECPDLRRVHAHLSQGTRPSKRDVKIQDVKRYLQRVTIASNDLLVVVSDAPFRAATERIVVSRSVLHGLVTAVHLRFNHPSPYQMQQVMARYFYALDMEGAIKATCSSCHHCNSLKYIPPPLVPQSSCSPPDIIGSSFALDVMRRAGQCILILRETVSSYAVTRLIDNEQHQTFRDAILSLVTEMRSCCRSVEGRVDNASGLKALESDSVLKSHDIILVCVRRDKECQQKPCGRTCSEGTGVGMSAYLPWRWSGYNSYTRLGNSQYEFPYSSSWFVSQGSVIRWLATNWLWTIAKSSSNSTVNALWTMVLVRYPNLKAKVRTLYPIYMSVIWCTLWVMVTKPRPVRSTWSLTCAQMICVWWGNSLSPSFGPSLTRSRCVCYTLWFQLPCYNIPRTLCVVLTIARRRLCFHLVCLPRSCLSLRPGMTMHTPCPMALHCPHLTLSSHHSHHPQVHVISLLPHAGPLIHPHLLSH